MDLKSFKDWFDKQEGSVKGAVITALVGFAGLFFTGCFTIMVTLIQRPPTTNPTQVVLIINATPNPTFTSSPSRPTAPASANPIQPRSTETSAFPAAQTDIPILNDEFQIFNNDIWKMESIGIQQSNSIYIEDGKLYFDHTNEEEEWNGYYIQAKNLPEYSAIEFKIGILESSGFSSISFNTNCHGEDKGSLFVEAGWNSKISGLYEVTKGGVVELVNLGWGKSAETGTNYTVFLHQDKNLVRTSINGIEMPAQFPCERIGPNLFIGSTADKGNHIKGFLEYVKVWK